MANLQKDINVVKNGFKTTEFYLASFVTLIGTVSQFLPANVATSAVKVAGAIAAVLASLGYTASRTIVKK